MLRFLVSVVDNLGDRTTSEVCQLHNTCSHFKLDGVAYTGDYSSKELRLRVKRDVGAP